MRAVVMGDILIAARRRGSVRLTRSVEMSTLHWYCFSFDIASSLWS